MDRVTVQCLKDKKEVYTCDVLKSELEKPITIKRARETIKNILEEDGGLKIAYISNIAMLLHDRYGITDINERNQAARDILYLLFY